MRVWNEEAILNITTTFLGVIGFAIVGPLVLAAVIAGVMTWLSRQVPVGAAAAPEAALAKARSQKPPAGKPASPRATVAPLATAVEPQAAGRKWKPLSPKPPGLKRKRPIIVLSRSGWRWCMRSSLCGR